eukprot:TRINITY_DN12919_c0_g1_i1.p1 TRINITY_DN12919_c0_g1~~TRINITY_DN12919_c0_g1_i1.p1  ORF type:complete len:148 (+),score=6.56 TRINITY_DN12919_c0_g1_i1:263-706(+)
MMSFEYMLNTLYLSIVAPPVVVVSGPVLAHSLDSAKCCGVAASDHFGGQQQLENNERRPLQRIQRQNIACDLKETVVASLAMRARQLNAISERRAQIQERECCGKMARGSPLNEMTENWHSHFGRVPQMGAPQGRKRNDGEIRSRVI